jgi:flagellin-like protein
MKTSLQTHRRKAISPIIATILVVAMTIVAAGVLYTYFTTTASRAQNTNQIQVSASLAVPSGSGTGYGTITVTNSGSIALTKLTASDSSANCGTFTLSAWNPDPTIAPIAPGGGTSTSFTCSTATSGTSTAISIIATFANGATQTQVLTVTSE